MCRGSSSSQTVAVTAPAIYVYDKHWDYQPSTAVSAQLDENTEAALLRISNGKLDDARSKRARPCVPAAKVEERFSAFFDDSDDEDNDSNVTEVNSSHRTEDLLRTLKNLGHTRDRHLQAHYMEPLVAEGAAALHDAARLASHKLGASLTFAGC